MKNVELKKYENMLGKHTGLTLKICKTQLFYSLGKGKPLGVQPSFPYFEFISQIYRRRAQLQITGNCVRIEFPNSEPFDLLFLSVTGGCTHPIVSALWAYNLFNKTRVRGQQIYRNGHSDVSSSWWKVLSEEMLNIAIVWNILKIANLLITN